MKDNTIKRILVPVDFSETSDTATTNAVILAKLLNAEVFLLNVLEHNPHNTTELNRLPELPSTLTDMEESVTNKMSELQENLISKLAINPHINIVIGYVATEIINFSVNNGIDLIIMGTHGLSGYKEMFLGSMAQHVVNHSMIPVLTMQMKCNKPNFKNILLPIDNSMHSREKVNIAIIFAQIFNATISIISLTDSQNQLELNKFNTKIKSVEDILTEDEIPWTTTPVHGENLALAAIDYATNHKMDLIVINTGHESKMTDNFIGAFAQKIINHSRIPVLSIKHTETHYRMDTPGLS